MTKMVFSLLAGAMMLPLAACSSGNLSANSCKFQMSRAEILPPYQLSAADAAACEKDGPAYALFGP